MKNLFNLLERFSQSLNRDSLTREEIIKTIKNHTNISLKEDSLSLKNGVLILTASPSYNNEIKFKEEKIVRELQEKKIPLSRILYR